MDKKQKTKRSKIIEEKIQLFDGLCPECSDDDLEQIDGIYTEYQDLKCSNGHEFCIQSLGWEVI